MLLQSKIVNCVRHVSTVAVVVCVCECEYVKLYAELRVCC